MYLKKQNR